MRCYVSIRVLGSDRFYEPDDSCLCRRIRCLFSDATIGQPYRIQVCADLPGNSWTDFTNFTYTGPVVINDEPAGSTTKQFFRAVSP